MTARLKKRHVLLKIVASATPELATKEADDIKRTPENIKLNTFWLIDHLAKCSVNNVLKHSL